jgi:predicted Zn-dependent protease
MNPRIESLEKMLGGPRDGALLRFSLGNEYLKAESPAQAAAAFQAAVDRDPNYSAAWKALGKALLASGDDSGALAAYERDCGGRRPRRHPGRQEMNVFARRLRKAAEA